MSAAGFLNVITGMEMDVSANYPWASVMATSWLMARQAIVLSHTWDVTEARNQYLDVIENITATHLVLKLLQLTSCAIFVQTLIAPFLSLPMTMNLHHPTWSNQ
jgi:ABC-type Co2+ transport system permease subunit